MENENIPAEYKPLSAWAYFGYNLLFSIPVLGLICLIVFAFNNNNINRKNFARSFFCGYILLVIVFVIVAVLSLGSSFAISS